MAIRKKNNTLIIIPVFNEELSIGTLLESLKAKENEADIMVVDDGSGDKTLDVVVSKGVFVVAHPFNMGIGTSFQTGCCFALESGYDYIVRIDGDGQHEPASINDVLSPVKSGKFDIAIGSRFLGASKFKSSFMRIIGITIIARLLTFLTGKKVTDPTSGFCAMNKKAFSFFARYCVDDYPEPEILIHHRDFGITEVPINLMKRKEGSSSITPLKSLYYMYKVIFSIIVSIFRKE